MAYPIGQLATQTGENIKTLRYWSDFGLLSHTHRPNGYREYLIEAVEEVRFIRKAQRLGLTLQEILTIFTLGRTGMPVCQVVQSGLQHTLENVQQNILELRALESRLVQCLEWAQDLETECLSPQCVIIAQGS
ncbi:MerR family transcriptional regulator [Deinococcus cellulosilyticus]|uniref:Cu(I)-responsive transcriptional regulator n=1 Tax=Deinococcus cellulosilyticus (strain DSM 18568 / NBRC 106333 / KACC 11606 / 5516J-15) TaxID=1223518 RepID=A0A511NBG5_DEIC1|nr:MerR family transcriptional regulator [Deinococcus cellulosilyticus]GEM50169.1 Cu(I)-responsive transcriptional regulator [Deinococcus cellulosilyticus NBRC 106333 = KACC 11606]